MKKLTSSTLTFTRLWHFGQIYPGGLTNGTWAPTLTGFSANPASSSYTYTLQAGWCCLNVAQGADGTSSTTGFLISLPFTAATVANGIWGVHANFAVDNSVVQENARAYLVSGGTTATIDKSVTTPAWTASGGKRVAFSGLCYPIA
jgi:hypothetical protein